MTDQEIYQYIELLNNGNAIESILIRTLGEHVDLAKVWNILPEPDDDVRMDFFSYRFFFIRNESNEYVGGIFDMEQDLHWYIVPEHRKKGHLTKALQEVVLPYLLDELERDSQKVTIQHGSIGSDNYKSSIKVAQNVGFVPYTGGTDTYILNRENFDWNNVKIYEEYTLIEETRIEELKKRAHYAFKVLYKIKDEIEMAGIWDPDFEESIRKLRYFPMNLEDRFWNGR